MYRLLLIGFFLYLPALKAQNAMYAEAGQSYSCSYFYNNASEKKVVLIQKYRLFGIPYTNKDSFIYFSPEQSKVSIAIDGLSYVLDFKNEVIRQRSHLYTDSLSMQFPDHTDHIEFSQADEFIETVQHNLQRAREKLTDLNHETVLALECLDCLLDLIE